MENKIVVKDFHETNVKPENLQYVIDKVKEVHPSSAGWDVGDPIIESKNPDGSVNVSVTLMKYPVEKGCNGRSM